MLMALCTHYDVTSTYLLDDERPVEPQPRDRLSERNSLICRGDWLEVTLPNGMRGWVARSSIGVI